MTRRDAIKAKILARSVRTDDGCLIWTGPTSGTAGRGRGYPRMNLDGATVAVHIASFVCENGPIPPKKQIDHICRNRLCVNPSHLQMVTHKQNQRRRDAARAKEADDARSNGRDALAARMSPAEVLQGERGLHAAGLQAPRPGHSP